ncbi:hypothetical protein PSOLE_37780 [Pseudomonas oleovorans subsp. oleovorans]|uniref:Uncharacterized protein n=1 Tax=Ectopseudomonas oleovorans TaxID=301 RepID=A0A379JWY9_ECTOL|nr:hypothetical protein PSOLE_37780 [Pseudomonas oleovorans subsp. oleovorans]SEJ66887.1 hypothetical protein SAMN05216280_103516 [Pseudomonas oleovorans]SUD53147.1 Uncharacterised protein [Pseudomonas oleovorans]
MQRGMIGEVLLHREVEIQRALLEHHAELTQRLAWLLAQAVAEDADIALLQVVQAGEQGDQRGLAGAVGAEQGTEAAWRQIEGQVVERLAGTIGETDAAHLQRIHGVTTTPQG